MTATATPPEEGGATRSRPDPTVYVGQEMTLYEHLEELRSRLFKCAVAIALGFAVGFVFRGQVLDLMREPYCSLPVEVRHGLGGNECTLIVLRVLDAFFVSLKAAAIVAVVLAGPVVCYQVWRFVTPGLRPVERRYALPFVVVTQLLFAGGAVLAYLLIPKALAFLLAFAGEGITPVLGASEYLSFVLQTMIAFGMAFEFPVILAALSLMGVVTSEAMRRVRRYALFGTFVAAAIITPTQDPLTMSLMAGPLVLFYEGSILFARLVERRRARRTAAA